jgi:hypothetical protein
MDHDTEGVLANIDQARLSREGIKLVGAIELLLHYRAQVENILNNRKHVSPQSRTILLEILSSMRIDQDAAMEALRAVMEDGGSKH